MARLAARLGGASWRHVLTARPDASTCRRHGQWHGKRVTQACGAQELEKIRLSHATQKQVSPPVGLRVRASEVARRRAPRARPLERSP